MGVGGLAGLKKHRWPAVASIAHGCWNLPTVGMLKLMLVRLAEPMAGVFPQCRPYEAISPFNLACVWHDMITALR